jgi:hypothetical protein
MEQIEAEFNDIYHPTFYTAAVTIAKYIYLSGCLDFSNPVAFYT